MTVTEPQTSTDLVTLTIDGVEVSVPKGTLVIRAAEQIGTQIPRFCDHPLLAPAGACAGSASWRWRASASRSPPAPSRSPRAWWSAPRSARRWPRRPSAA